MTGGAWIGWRQDEDGVVVLTLDAPVADANRFSADFSDVLEQVVERIETAKDQLSGIVIASTKSSFCLDSDPSGVLRAERTQAGALSAVLARDAALLRLSLIHISDNLPVMRSSNRAPTATIRSAASIA